MDEILEVIRNAEKRKEQKRSQQDRTQRNGEIGGWSHRNREKRSWPMVSDAGSEIQAEKCSWGC